MCGEPSIFLCSSVCEFVCLCVCRSVIYFYLPISPPTYATAFLFYFYFFFLVLFLFIPIIAFIVQSIDKLIYLSAHRSIRFSFWPSVCLYKYIYLHLYICLSILSIHLPSYPPIGLIDKLNEMRVKLWVAGFGVQKDKQLIRILFFLPFNLFI